MGFPNAKVKTPGLILQSGVPVRAAVKGSTQMNAVRISNQNYIFLKTVFRSPDGRAQATSPSQQVQMSLFDFNGDLWLGDWAGDDEGELGAFRQNEVTDHNIGFAPFFQHTTSAKPRTCDTCHRTDESADEMTRVRGVYGYGTGEFMLDNPHGESVDALRFLDADGNPAFVDVLCAA